MIKFYLHEYENQSGFSQFSDHIFSDTQGTTAAFLDDVKSQHDIRKSELDEEMGLAAASDTDFGNLDVGLVSEKVGTAGTLCPLLPLPLGSGGVGVLEVVCTADTTATLLGRPVTN